MTEPFPHGVIDGPASVTDVVLKAMSRTPDARLRELMESLVRNLHEFVRETRPTEEEFEHAVDFLVRLGQASGAEKNEVILASDLLGLSTLIVLLQGAQAAGVTDAALLGPFWRGESPSCRLGDDIARDSGGGKRLTVSGHVRDAGGAPVAGAVVDVWQASPVGLYENQDEHQPEHNLRGRFETDAAGRFYFDTVKPSGYPVPTDGPCGELLRAQRRHPFRPAHIHFMISHEGYRTLVTQVFDNADAAIESDVVFGVTPRLAGDFRARGDGTFALEYDFVLEPGTRRIPRPPLP
ncbi:MAG TPA: dioxygenase [Usitatibacter sp.]|nr:dioxygenase [Usitatibacter sp.]